MNRYKMQIAKPARLEFIDGYPYYVGQLLYKKEGKSKLFQGLQGRQDTWGDVIEVLRKEVTHIICRVVKKSDSPKAQIGEQVFHPDNLRVYYE